MGDESMPRPGGCVTVANQEICVDADVEVVPFVRVGPPRAKCVGPPVFDDCGCGQRHPYKPCGGCGESHPCPPCGEPSRPPHKPSCRFCVRQVIRVSVPLFFDAKVEAEIAKVQCGVPSTGPCPQ
jgi:hypothetical protein